jgi:N-acetylglucosamine malate deacetylase 2
MKNFSMKKTLFSLLSLLSFLSAFSQKVLIINAHPDDESGCAASVYKITQELGGIVDLAIVTNGEAGYKYSLLAEKIYEQKLTTPEVGRKYLPKIRKKELRKGCNWVGIRHIFHYNQLDTHYTLDPDTVMKSVWDVENVMKKLSQKIEKEQYDYIFCVLPTLETHGHHKAATIIALETVQNLTGKKPVVLGISVGMKIDTTEKAFTGLTDYPLTAIGKGHHAFMMDRTAAFGHKDKLNYKLVVNWLIAEHKSQGTMQTFMNQGDYEFFWWFDINDKANWDKTQQLFDKLAKSRPNSLPMTH